MPRGDSALPNAALAAMRAPLPAAAPSADRSAGPSRARAEMLEQRTLLTAAPIGPEFQVNTAAESSQHKSGKGSASAAPA